MSEKTNDDLLDQDDAPLSDPKPAKKSTFKARWLRRYRVSMALSSVALLISLGSLAVSGYAVMVTLAGAWANGRMASDGRVDPAMPMEVNSPAPVISRLGPEGMAIVRDVIARSGFSLNPHGPLVVMFADPNCPACRQFHQMIAQDQYKTFAPLVTPVGFLPGSRELAAAVLCAKDQKKAWEQVLSGHKLTAKACKQGLEVVDLNNAAFQALGFSQTPTFVALDGAFLSEVKSPEAMIDWAQDHYSVPFR